MSKKRKVALVLAGGGAKSLCQIGVLKVLEQEKIPIGMIVGCSMGSVIGALFSLKFPVVKIEEMFLKFCRLRQVEEIERKFTHGARGISRVGDFLRELGFYLVEWLKEGVWKEENLLGGLKSLIPGDLTFSQTKIPFACVATDIRRGRRIVLHKGNVLSAIVASSSIPGLFTPVREKDEILVDGGVLSKVPVTAAEKLGADFIIAISAGSLKQKEPSKAIEVLVRMTRIREWEFARIESLLADFLFSPSVNKWHWYSFSHAQEIIQKGEKEARKKISLLKQALKESDNREKKELRKLVLSLFY
jgi:NTE family protein